MDTRDETATAIQSRFREDIAAADRHSPKRLYLTVIPGALGRVARYLFADLGARFNTASGVDMADRIEVLYHFTIEPRDLLVSVRVVLDRDHPIVDSLTALFPAANWIEREINEMLGVDFPGHPDLHRLLLPDEWPKKVHPLRRDYVEWDPTAVRDRGVP